MIEKTIKPTKQDDFQDAIADLELDQPLIIEEDFEKEGNWLVFTQDDRCIGRLSSRTWVAKELYNGMEVLHASVNSVCEPEDGEDYSITIRVVTGEPGETFEMPPVIEKSYLVGLSGESYRQKKIKECRIGDIVALEPEPDNQYDDRAIAAKVYGELIGYLPRDGWLTTAILDQGKEVSARISDLNQADNGKIGVVLRVTFGGAQEKARVQPVPAKPVSAPRIPSTSLEAQMQPALAEPADTPEPQKVTCSAPTVANSGSRAGCFGSLLMAMMVCGSAYAGFSG